MLFVKHLCHQGLLNLIKGTICHGDSCPHSQWLSRKASLTEEFTVTQNGDNRFLAVLGCNCEFYLAFSEIEQRIRRSRELDVDPKLVADQLGHSVDVNLNVYTKTVLDLRKQALDALESAVSGA